MNQPIARETIARKISQLQTLLRFAESRMGNYPHESCNAPEGKMCNHDYARNIRTVIAKLEGSI